MFHAQVPFPLFFFCGQKGRHPVLDVAIDGADEVDPSCDCIKGGGACQTQEKVVAACAKVFVLVADFRKESRALGTLWKAGVPVEIVPMARRPVEERLRALGGRPQLRMGVKKVEESDFGFFG